MAKGKTPDTDSDSDLFEYTSGKWIYNDSLRHSERRKLFNITDFKKLAAQSINQSEKDIINFTKLAEGGFNRSFLITMRDEFQFVARIPFPVTEPKSLLIASEVATMDFLRAHGFPIPRVFGYSTVADNPAGTEYIFMELVQGINLGDVWFDLSDREQTTIITNLVQLESKLMAMRFPAGGSLYYSDDLPLTHPRIPIQTENLTSTSKNLERQFCIGPDTSFRLWFGKRLNLPVERGPYQDCFAALTTGATKEIHYLEKHGTPLLPFQRLRREIYNYQPQSHLEHIQNLKKYLAITPYLIPGAATSAWQAEDDEESEVVEEDLKKLEEYEYLRRPVIRHPDLRPNNVIVTANLEVKGLIDWQHSTILPLCLQSGIPSAMKSHESTNMNVDLQLERPTPSSRDQELEGRPQSVEEESKSENTSTTAQRDSGLEKVVLLDPETRHRRYLQDEYIKQTARLNPDHHDALLEKLNTLRRRLWHHAGDPWEGDTVTLKADLVEVYSRWADITSTASDSRHCPISFSAEEARECLRLDIAQAEADEQLRECQSLIGVGSEGWMPVEKAEKVRRRERKFKMESLDAALDEEERRLLEENWIFDDFDEGGYT